MPTASSWSESGDAAGPAGQPDHPPQEPNAPSTDGKSVNGEDALAITNAIVRLLRVHAGRGPTQARTIISSDLIVVHLRDCLTTAEKTIHGNGQRELVTRGRDVLHAAIRDEATAAVEEISGRRVTAYLHSQEADPDHALIAFVLDRDSGS